MFAPRWAERAVVTKPAKRYAKGAYQTRWPHRANNGEGDEVEMVEKYRRRFPAHTDDRAACVAASYLMLRDLWNEAAAGAGVEAEVMPCPPVSPPSCYPKRTWRGYGDH
jgi:hypothetical protein